MPKYNTFRYGTIAKYGRYDLGTGIPDAIGPYIRYRMRLRSQDGKGEHTVMFGNRIELPPNVNVGAVRIRCNDSDWVHIQSTEVGKETHTVRIRSIGPEGQLSDWVVGNKANLKLI